LYKVPSNVRLHLPVSCPSAFTSELLTKKSPRYPTMRSSLNYAIAFAAFATGIVEAQAPKGGAPSTTPKAPAAKGKCEYTKNVKSFPNPLDLFPPGSAVFPCDMGSAVPLGKVPTGCAQLEIIYGQYFRFGRGIADLEPSLMK
jgi:hypothetical protein